MADVFYFVLKASLYAGIVGLVIILIKALLRNRLSARWHYLLWMVLVLKLLIPFGPESVVSLFNTVPDIPRQSMSEMAYQMEQRYEASLAEENTLPYIPPTQQQVEAIKAAALVESLLPYAWAAGAAFILLWLVFTCCSLHRKLRRCLPVTDERIIHIFDACKVKMGLERSIKISLIVQDAVGTPSLFGVRFPKILLPPAVLSLSDKELEYILLHELAHYKRKDVPVNYLLLAFQTVHWFNPVIWYCFRRIRQDMEIAADELVLSILESTEYKDYGRALLAALEGFAAPKLAPKLLGMVDDRKNIERRLNMIKMAGFFKSRRRLALVVGILCFAVSCVVLLTSGQTIRDRKPSSGFSGYNAFRLHAYPEKYALTMSGMPGIRIAAEYSGPAARVRYSTENGALLTWDISTKVSNGLPAIELHLGTPVYWSPLDPAGQIFEDGKNTVTVTLLDEQGERVDEKQVMIIYDGSLYYTVQPSLDIVIGGEPLYFNQKPGDIENTVSLAIKSRRHSYGAGETATEGHIILDSKEDNGTVKVYTIASFGAFGFENGIFTKVSGSGAIPTVMIFSRDNNGGYSLLEYQEPMDGAYYVESIKKMFPKKLQDRALTSRGEDYAELARQQEAQAAEYLKSIGRTAEVSAAHVKKQLADINVEASNKLFSEYTKYDLFLNNCPYWIGTRERIENGTRYIYETSQSKTGDGYELMIFRKTKEDGAVVEERRYKIVGGEPQLI